MHRLVIMGDAEGVSDAVVEIMKERGATLMKRTPIGPTAFFLSFKTERERNTGATAQRDFGKVVITNTSERSVSEFFVALESSDGKVTVEGVGVPLFNGRTGVFTGCPALIRERFLRCTPADSWTFASFSDAVHEDTGLTVDGRAEAELLDGLFAELQGKKWSDRYRTIDNCLR